MSRTELVETSRTPLFVSGSSPEKFNRARSSGADLVVVDWEDSVPSSNKKEARKATVEALSAVAHHEATFFALIRVDSSSLEQDIRLLSELFGRGNSGILGIMLPKVSCAAEVESARELLPRQLALVPLIESALGIKNVGEIAQVEGVTRLAFGAIDFALDMFAGQEGPLLDYARAALVIASRAAGISAPLDSPVAEFGDLSIVERAAMSSKAFGFGGMMCIHPAQIPVVALALRPNVKEVEWARQVLEMSSMSARIATQMVDEPVRRRAKRILSQVGEI